MPRPILTDEIIEQAKRDKEKFEQNLRRELESDQEISEKYDEIEQKLSKQAVYKSRRIEMAKQKQRSKTINKWLFFVIAIVVILGGAFFLYYFYF